MIARVASSGIALLPLVTLMCAQQPGLPAPGSAVDAAIGPGDVHRYAVDTATSQVRLVMTLPPGLPATVKLIRQDGSSAGQRSSTLDLLFSTAAAEAGAYTIEVSALSSGHG